MSTGTDVFRVMLSMEIRHGREAAFERAWVTNADVVANHPGNLGHWLSVCDGEPGRYVIVSDWTDETSFRQFESSGAHLRHRAILHPFRSSGQITVMNGVRFRPDDERPAR